MAQATRKDPNKPDVAERIEWFAGNADAHKEAYAEGVELVGKPKTVDPYADPENDQLNQNGFVGTDPIYQNYASVGGRPLTEDDSIGEDDFDKGSPLDLEDDEAVSDEGNASNPHTDARNAVPAPTTPPPTK